MSRFEIIAIAAIVVLVGIGLSVSYAFHARHEQGEPVAEKMQESDFDKSFGADFRMGAFTRVVAKQVSGTAEGNCASEESVIAAVLHDLATRLGSATAATSSWSAFEVNTAALELFCNTSARVTLADDRGDTLTITKPPFTRAVPSGDTSANVGTLVHLDAALIRAGTNTVAATTSAELLIPDKYLDATNTTP